MKDTQKQIINYLFITTLFLEFIFIVLTALTWGKSNIDEFEHLHASWLVWEGLFPYRDFFEHHHPLLWYLFAPFTALFYNNANIYYFGHFFAMLASIFSLYYIYKIITKFIADKQTALLILIVFMAFNPVGRIYLIEFRPDTFMNLFFWSGLYYFITYLQKPQCKKLVISFILFTISVLFIQKILLLYVFLGIYIIRQQYTKKIKFTDFVKALIIPIIIFISFILWLYFNNALSQYFLLNFSLNSLIPQYYGLQLMIFQYQSMQMQIPLTNGYASVAFKPFTIITVISALICGISFAKKNSNARNIIIILFGGELFLRINTFSPYYHYFYLIEILSFIIIFSTLSKFKNKFMTGIYIIVAFYYAISSISDSIYNYNNQNMAKHYVKQAQFVIDNTEDSDLLINGNEYNFNLFRHDCDYMWFLLNDIGYIYNTNFGNPDYDINKIITTKLPKIIWVEDYINTPFSRRRAKYLSKYNADILYLFSKYPDKKLDLQKLIANYPQPLAYKLNMDIIEKYYQPTNNEKFWKLKDDINL